DFAKLQGIDRQVLAAVIERPEELGRSRLSALRTALACTTGYFDSLKDTVRQRTTFSVNLDVEIGDNALIRLGDISSFVSRYLNAVRIQDSTILQWYEGRSDNEDMGTEPVPVPVRCESCPHKDPCHTGFGSVNGIGLYPFTSKALERMYARIETQGRFNPR